MAEQQSGRAPADETTDQRHDREERERRKGLGLPEDAPDGVVKSAEAQGQPEAPELSQDEQKGALEYLLAPQRALRYEVPVELDTAGGRRTLTFVVKQIDSAKIDSLERTNVDEKTGRINRLQNNAELVATALESLQDETGTTVAKDDDRIRTGADGQMMPNLAEALKARFYFQAGLLAGVAEQVRVVSGWGPDRVGTAQRVLVEAAGNS